MLVSVVLTRKGTAAEQRRLLVACCSSTDCCGEETGGGERKKEERREEQRLGEREGIATFGVLRRKVVSRERVADSFGEVTEAAGETGEREGERE